MSIVSDALAAHTPSVMRSALSHRRTMRHCGHSSALSDVGSCGNGRKLSIIIRLRRHARSGDRRRASGTERCTNRGHREILLVKAAMPRTARSVGVFGMLHRTTARGADLIEGIVESSRRSSRRYCFLSGTTATERRRYIDSCSGRRVACNFENWKPQFEHHTSAEVIVRNGRRVDAWVAF